MITLPKNTYSILPPQTPADKFVANDWNGMYVTLARINRGMEVAYALKLQGYTDAEWTAKLKHSEPASKLWNRRLEEIAAEKLKFKQ